MANIYLFLAIIFFFIFFVGRLLEKIRIPWVFAALLLGSVFAFYNPFSGITGSPTFDFLAHLGMYFLLFIIGLEINLKELKKKSKFIFKSTFVIIFLEAIFGSLFIHFIFDYNLLISCLVALSFATVGEAVLVPILDEFKMVNTKLGQSIIGIGTVDDSIEMILLVIVTIIVGAGGFYDIAIMIGALLCLFMLTVLFTELKSKREKFSFHNMETLFFFVMFVFLLFLGVGYLAEATALGALLAGISIKTFMPPQRVRMIDKEIKATSYGFFVPIFFLWVGASMDFSYIIDGFLIILLLVLVSNGAKILGSYISARKELGTKQSILLGIGLSIRFSTSIVIVKILYDNNLIDVNLYSLIIASSIIFKFVVPLLFSNLLVRWVVPRKKAT